MSDHFLVRPRCCKTCPFKGGFYLGKARRQDIHNAVMVKDKTFQCHSEVDHTEDDEGNPWADTGHARQCAGATTLSLRADNHNQIMRVAGRLGEEPVEDPSVPFTDWDSWINEAPYNGAGRPRHGQ